MATGGVPYDSSGSTPVKLKKKRPTVGRKPIKKNPPLAKPKAKKQPAPAPYDPLAPLAPAAIEENARARAQSQVQPELDTLAGIGRDMTGAHDTRAQELKGWYTGLQGNLDKSFTQTSDALNRLITLNNQGGADENNILAAALKSGNQPVEQAAGMMQGVQAPTSNDAQILASAAANVSNQSNFVGANAMGAVQAQGERRPLASIGLMEAGLSENRRYDAQRKELANQTIDVARRIPELQNASRQDIQALEAQKLQLGEAKANRLFQQYLAEKELNLKTRNQSFQEYLGEQNLGLQKSGQALDAAKFKHQTQIDWAQIGLNQREIEARLAEIRGGKKDDRSKLRAKQWDNGLSMLQAYMQPGDGEGPIGVEDPKQLVDPKTGSALQPYRRKYDDAMRILTGRAKMSRRDALNVLAASDFGSWRSRARKELTLMKASPSTRGAVSAIDATRKSLRKK